MYGNTLNGGPILTINYLLTLYIISILVFINTLKAHINAFILHDHI